MCNVQQHLPQTPVLLAPTPRARHVELSLNIALLDRTLGIKTS